MRHLSLATATLISIAAGLPLAAAEEGERPVQVNGMAVQPYGNLRYADGALSVHPKAALGLGWDSNVYTTASGEKSDGYLSALAGVQLGWTATRQDEVALDAEIGTQQYFEETDRSGSFGHIDAKYVHRAQDWRSGAMAGWTRTNDPLVQIGTRIERDNYDAQAYGDLMGNNTLLHAGLVFGRTDYREAVGGLGVDDRDRNIYGAMVRGDYAYAKDSKVYVRLYFDQSAYDKKVAYQDSTGIYGFAGIEQKYETRTRFFAELGAMYRSYDHPFVNDPAYDDETVVYPAGNLGVKWEFEEQSLATGRVFTQLDESSTANAAFTYGLSADLRYRLADRTAALAGASVYQAVDSGAPAGSTEEKRTTFELKGGAEYQLPRGASLRVLATYTDSDSEKFNDFSRLTLLAEVAAAF